jgi:hypothetical protein
VHTHSALHAAFRNGTFAHSMDFDDTNIHQNGAAIHPGAPIIAAALADAERSGVNTGDFYRALAVGYEVDCRVAAALDPASYDRGFHTTAIAGIFGAVVATARLRGLDTDTTLAAFGLATSKAAGSMQYLTNGSWNKRLHPGFVAHDALLRVELAQACVVGAAEPLDLSWRIVVEKHRGNPRVESEPGDQGSSSCCRSWHRYPKHPRRFRRRVVRCRASCTSVNWGRRHPRYPATEVTLATRNRIGAEPASVGASAQVNSHSVRPGFVGSGVRPLRGCRRFLNTIRGGGGI